MFSGPLIHPHLDAASLRRPSGERAGGGGAAAMPELDEAVRELQEVSAVRPLALEQERSPVEQRQSQRYALEARLQAARAGFDDRDDRDDEDGADNDGAEVADGQGLEGRIRALLGGTPTSRPTLDLLG